MDISLRIVIPSLLLFVLFIVDLGEGHNSCPELQCGDDGPPIRFPFRLKDRQPDQHCGYPGFDLYCSHNNVTVLELPTSVKVFVKQIDYKSQLIEVTDSDNCFPWKILGLHLSPFQFIKNSLYNYSLFNCTPYTPYPDSSYLVSCLNSSSISVYAFPSDYGIDDLSILSCTKMYSISSVPYNTWNYHYSLELTWSEPAKCGHCERKGKKCRFQNNSTDLKTECFPNKGKSRQIVATGSILGSFLLVLVVYALYRVYRYDKAEKENQARIEKFLEDYKAFKPTSA